MYEIFKKFNESLSLDLSNDDIEYIKDIISDFKEDNKNYYMCVNSNPDEYHIPTRTLSQEQFDIEEEPVYYYLSKSDIKPVSWSGKIPIREHHKNVINYLNNNKVEDINPEKKVKSFWDYFRK